MGLHRDYDEKHTVVDIHLDESPHELGHKRHLRKMLEARLEHKRLKEELEDYEGELDDEFDWDFLDR